MGLGDGFQIQASLPVHLQLLSTRYHTGDGERYAPPYPNTDPASTRAGGLADGQLMGRFFGKAGDGWVLGAGLGLSLPFAPPPENPLELGNPELPRAFQAGTGTFDPVVDLQAIANKGRWGGWIGLSGRFPMYTNGRGYRPGIVGAVSVGPSVRPTQALQLLVTADLVVEGRLRWDDERRGGRVAFTPAVAAVLRASPTTVLQLRLATTAWQQPFDPEKEPQAPLLLAAFGVSWTSRGQAAPAIE